MSTVHNSEPFIRMAKRDSISRPKAWGIRLASVLLALIISGLFIYSITALNPIDVYKAMYEGALGTNRRIWITIRDIMMLLCISVGLAPAFRMRFWYGIFGCDALGRPVSLSPVCGRGKIPFGKCV